MLREMSAHRALAELKPEAHLERDLGLDSLARVELLARLEEEFGGSLPDAEVARTDTVAGICRLIARGGDPVRLRAAPGPRVVPGTDRPTPAAARTIPEVLFHRAASEPDRPHVFLCGEDDTETELTYAGLLAGAEAVAAGLKARGLARGEAVALMLPTGPDFLHCFFGILLAGGVPVPLYPPLRPDRVEEYVRRQSAILRNADARFLIAFAEAGMVARALATVAPSLQDAVTSDEIVRAGAGRSPSPGETVPEETLPGETALIQYTSGSTGTPKGVVLSHAAILANIRAFGEKAELRGSDVCVSWLPLYHDMGLIGAWLGSLYHGIPLVLMSPLAFLARPARWLWAIHSHRATVTAAPNFAYEICARRIPDKSLEGLDLSSLRVAFNGAEPVSPATLARFAEKFGKHGLKAGVVLPVYGLAENSLCLACPSPGGGPRVDLVDRDALEREGRAVPAGRKDSRSLEIVSCGPPLPGFEVRLVDPGTGAAVGSERTVGQLLFRGPSAAAGYHRNPGATAALVRDGWLDSGDLAYLSAGEVFITGRSKDLIIRGGRNIAPQELEEVAGDVPGVRKGCVVAFGVTREESGTEQIVVIAETRETGPTERRRISSAVIAAIADATGVPPDVVELMPPGAIPKTSSGKIARSQGKASYEAGTLARRRAPWLQAGRVLAGWAWNGIRKIAGRASSLLYGAYVGGCLAVTTLPLWAAVACLPRGDKSARTARRLFSLQARTFLRLAGYPLAVEGRENLAPGVASVFVSNHTSYLDVLALAASLPPDFAFVAKRELLAAPVVGSVIRKARYLTVDRSDPSRAATAKEIASLLRAGQSVLLFPEGTFTSATGLRPFTLGAFTAAAETGRAIRPLAIRGCRSIMRGDRILPRPGRIEVTIGRPIPPAGAGWTEAVRLRDRAKAAIALSCGEPVLDIVKPGLPASPEQAD